MKLLLIAPLFDLVDPLADYVRLYLDAAADAISSALRPRGDETIFGLWHREEVGMAGAAYDAEIGGKRLVHFGPDAALRSAVRRALDPWDGYFAWLRCQTTCRSASFGYDGQAFLQLRHDDRLPRDNALLRWSDSSAMLIETDLFDG